MLNMTLSNDSAHWCTSSSVGQHLKQIPVQVIYLISDVDYRQVELQANDFWELKLTWKDAEDVTSYSVDIEWVKHGVKVINK